MRIHITDENGHKLSFSALKMTEWNHKQLAELLEEVVEILKSPTVEDKDLF